MTPPPNNNAHTLSLAETTHAGRPSRIVAPRAHVIANANQFGRLISPWRRLVASAAEPAIAATPGWLLPMYRHADPQDHGAATIAILGRTADCLAGIFPLQHQRARWLLPVSCLTTWSNEFCFSGLPLVSAEDPAVSLQLALETARDTFAARAVLFEKVPANGPFMAALQQLSRDSGLPHTIVDAFERAGLETGHDFETWFNDNFKRKKRKELRRLRTRLGETGRLESLTFQRGDDLSAWADDFLALESAGWKGRAGTALACSDHMSGFLQTALAMLHANGELVFWKLVLDGKPLAMLFAMLSGDQAWLGKIAYDEAFSKFSPGVLLILDATAGLLARDGIRLVDSSAVPDHPMINHIWRDRISINDVLIATPGTSHAAFQVIKAAEITRRSARAKAKHIYHRFLKGKAK